jgi:hypothetical protein
MLQGFEVRALHLISRQATPPALAQLFWKALWWLLKKLNLAGRQWLTPVILATQEAEIRRIMV